MNDDIPIIGLVFIGVFLFLMLLGARDVAVFFSTHLQWVP